MTLLIIQPPLAHGATHEAGGTDDLYPEHGTLAPTRIDTLNRDQTFAGQAATTAQVWFSYFTAPFAIAATKILIPTWTTAGTAATLVRVGLYTVAANGNLALAAASADLHAATDATNAGATYFQTASKLWSCALTLGSDLSTPISSYTTVRGQRYAIAFLQVTGGNSCTIGGISNLPQIMTQAPQESGVTTGGKADLATSYVASQSTTLASKMYAGLSV
jgi:hypothetical protein